MHTREGSSSPPTAAWPVDEIRRQFPALARAGRFAFFDNAAGAQIPQPVLDAVTDHLLSRNVQRGGPYRHSREVDAMIGRTRRSVAAFVNARNAEEIAFGLNATSFIRAISLAVGQTLKDRTDIVVSEMDHEANIATWLALERFGARIRWWRVRDDGRLYPSDLDDVLTDRTRLIACAVASNATGSVVDVAEVARRAHRVGAEVFLDAVHYAPHGAIDVQALDCDYLVCSGYKIFAPHMGFAWCRREAINRLPTFREDFIPDVTPDKLEAGTYVYENVAGMDAAVGYLERLGRSAIATDSAPRAVVLHAAMDAIAKYEQQLSGALLDAIESVRSATVRGVVDRQRLGDRVPTVSFTVEGVEASAIADALADRDIGARSGHMYSPRLMTRLGLMPRGVVRVSLVHYNTVEELSRFRMALGEIVDSAIHRAKL
jgi:cysteine desulfurase family protein (TIGR01976 family)